jgi:hypothetical protein
MKSGDLPAVHIGRSCRLPSAELQRYVDRLFAPATPATPPLHRHRRTSTDQGELFDVVPKPVSRPCAVYPERPVSGPTETVGLPEDHEREKLPMTRRTATTKATHPGGVR